MMWRFCTLLIFGFQISVNGHMKRSIELIAAHEMVSQEKLSGDTIPTSYHLFLQPFPADGYFEGTVRINVMVNNKSDVIILHADQDLQIHNYNITQLLPPGKKMEGTKMVGNEPELYHPTPLKLKSSKRVKNGSLFIMEHASPLEPGAKLQLYLQFSGKLFNETSEGMFRSSYVDSDTKTKKWFVSTHMRPAMARNVFPCYDEPMYKVPMVVSVARLKTMTAVSNMPRESTKPHETMDDWVWDIFRKSPPMSTFSLGIAISELRHLSYRLSSDKNIHLRVWTRSDFITEVKNVSEKVEASLDVLEKFWGCAFPLPKLDILALPNYKSKRSADSWGVILLNESDLSEQGSWIITNELVYQWLGSLTSPLWWSHAHMNHVLANYVTTYVIKKLNKPDPSRDWYISTLYSVYYEFSKRYPYSNNTHIEHYTQSDKNEFVLRMLNYTLGEKTFVHGMQRFMSDRKFDTFTEDDIWTSLNEQARVDKKLPQAITVNEIAASWISVQRLPLVTVTRNYQDMTAYLRQKVYLRDRPHDIPDQEKLLWWIPVVLVKQDKMNFDDGTPYTWMKKEREIRIDNLPGDDSFIIVNPEEIGPFVVNYDHHNWALLLEYLCSENRENIPVLTRTKLLHDAWNLAYAGDLNFATALNMTLFLKNEREFVVWERFFTMIDHVGRLIDGSPVHTKFRTYVKILLTSLYEELGKEPEKGESDNIANLRRATKRWLLSAGYEPLVREAQESFKQWIESSDEKTPGLHQSYLCPVFKWGTLKEWNLGLERVLQFPATGKSEDRFYLLKNLAGCSVDSQKIEKMLNITVLEQNGNFTDEDISLIFDMLTAGADGYKSLFSFLRNNWDIVKVRFEKKPNLWNTLIDSATTLFKTQDGLDLVSELYVEKQGEFGTAESLIKKGLIKIKEETKWSNENLPVMEKWLDQYIKTNDVRSV
ncbi:unnamed protein product [Phaedon cochleariae]|uniref:Aminopeptidase n=1 Tax=Phaedon cochleariae TaxID=80249 RepID=A0A9P0DEG9_PHACE|nr:unnamed protein product [Phaedon cochleariae]